MGELKRMKKVLLLTVCSLWFTLGVEAQYCGHFGNPSGNSQCTPTTNSTTKPGLYPSSDSLPPLLNCSTSDIVLQFKNFDTVSFGGQTLTVTWVRFDSIGNLPSGLCWTTNKVGNTFNGGESGCIKLSGNICSDPGQYRVKILITSNLSSIIPTTGDGDISILIRVNNPGDADRPVDTTQAYTLIPFISYNEAPICSDCFDDVISINAISSFSISPNPASTSVTISIDEGMVGGIATVSDVTGRKVAAVPLSTVNCQLSTDNFCNGVYFVTVSNKEGRSATKKLVVSR